MNNASAVNQTRWSQPSAARTYAADSHLMAAEQALFDKACSVRHPTSILDIGVGSGRTTSHLLALTPNYVGIDYSPAMIESCRARHPGVDFRLCDARNLHEFADGSFDLVFFSYNGIDCVDHRDRLQILNEIFRVCTPGGIFGFSTHNFAEYRRTGHASRQPNSSLSPRALIKRAIRLYRHRRLRHLEYYDHDHALINDQALGRTLLIYYVLPTAQIKQLLDCGFVEIVAIGADGVAIEALDDDRSQWIHFLCTKPL